MNEVTLTTFLNLECREKNGAEGVGSSMLARSDCLVGEDRRLKRFDQSLDLLSEDGAIVAKRCGM